MSTASTRLSDPSKSDDRANTATALICSVTPFEKTTIGLRRGYADHLCKNTGNGPISYAAAAMSMRLIRPAPRRCHGGRIIPQHREIRLFAHLDRADLVVQFQRIGRPQRDRSERLSRGDPLSRPQNPPLPVSRLTAHQAVNSGAIGVTGASEWMAMFTPASNAARQASMRSAVSKAPATTVWRKSSKRLSATSTNVWNGRIAAFLNAPPRP